MAVQVQGIINGRYIELEHETGLLPGQPVVVHVEPAPLTLDEKRQLLDLLCGSWSGDSTITEIFSEIDQERGTAYPREIDFDASS